MTTDPFDLLFARLRPGRFTPEGDPSWVPQNQGIGGDNIMPGGWIENSVATVRIDEDGLYIKDGALTLEDEYGLTVATASGFSGSWNDYIASGLYNPTFAAGVDGDVPDGRTAALPYWTVTTTGTAVLTRRTDSAAPSGHTVRVTFGALTDKIELLSDPVPVIGGLDYGFAAIYGLRKDADGTQVSISWGVKFYLADGTLDSGGLITSDDPGFGAGTAGTYPLGFHTAVFSTTAPLTSSYVRYYIRMEELTASHDADNYADFALAAVRPAAMHLAEDGSYIASSLELGSTLAGVGYLSVGSQSPGDALTQIFWDGSCWIIDEDSNDLFYLEGVSGTLGGPAGQIAIYQGNTPTEATSFTFAGEGSATFTGKSASYYQIGKIVIARLEFEVTANGSGGTAISITGHGLPAPAAQAVAFQGHRSAVGVIPLTARLTSSATLDQVRTLGTSGSALVTGADLANGASYVFTAVYEAA